MSNYTLDVFVPGAVGIAIVVAAGAMAVDGARRLDAPAPIRSFLVTVTAGGVLLIALAVFNFVTAP